MWEKASLNSLVGFPWDRCVETVIAEMQARQTPDVTSQAVGITMATAAAILLFFLKTNVLQYRCLQEKLVYLL